MVWVRVRVGGVKGAVRAQVRVKLVVVAGVRRVSWRVGG